MDNNSLRINSNRNSITFNIFINLLVFPSGKKELFNYE